MIKELSLKNQRTKLLWERLAIIQEAQVSAVSAGFAAASNLQLLRGDVLFKNFSFQPQVLIQVRTAPSEGPHVLGPEPKVLQNRVWTIRQTDRMAGLSVTFVQKSTESNKASTKTTSSTKKNQARTSVFERLDSPSYTTVQRRVSQDQFFRARLAAFALHWQSLLGSCRATSTVEDGVGIIFLQRPQLTHQCISFRARNSRQDLQQAVDAVLAKGTIERVSKVTSLRFYSQLLLVPKKTGDFCLIIDLSTLNRHMVVLHFKMETEGSIRTAIRSEEWTVSIDICDAYLHVPMHKAIRKYLHFVVNKRIYQFTCLPFGLATSSREFTKLLQPVIIETVRCQAARLLGRLADPCRYSRTGPTACLDDHQCAPVYRLDHQL